MTNQQQIKPVFKARPISSSNLITGMYTRIVTTSKTNHFIENSKGCIQVIESTLQISLDGENFHSIEFVNEAIILSKCFKCSYKNCFMRGDVSRTIKCDYEVDNEQ